MKSINHFVVRLLLGAILAYALELPAATPDGKNSGGPAGRQITAGAAPSGKLNFQTDLFTGNFGYSVPILGAPDRSGEIPSVAITYNSGGENSWCGMGWNLDFGFIQRETKHGVPIKWSSPHVLSEYDDAKGFVFSLNGTSSSLVAVGGGEYRAEFEGGFLKFQLDTTLNRWLVTDKSGNQYLFGESSGSRMESTRSGWTSGATKSTFRWALNKMVTASGDVSTITYTKDLDKLYPALYSYNGHTNGNFAPTHTIEFELENRTDDKPFTYVSGYKVQTAKRLKSVTCKVGALLVRKYQLAYTSSPSTKRTLLNSVTVVGNNGTDTLPPFSFTYQEKPFQFLQDVAFTNLYVPNNDEIFRRLHGTDGFGNGIADLVDIDGDGLPDRVLSDPSSPYTQFLVQRNSGTGFGPTNFWSPVGAQGKNTQHEWAIINSVVTRFADINGDGLPDRVMDAVAVYDNNATYSKYVVELNTGTGFGTQVDWSNVNAPLVDSSGQTTMFKAIENPGYVKLLDMNGDGLPDRVMRSLGKIISGTVRYTNYVVQFNTGSGFTATNLWGPIGAQTRTDSLDWAGLDSVNTRLTDLNGDGLPDRVMVRRDSTTNAKATGSNFDRFVVEFNNGTGFEAATDWLGVDPQTTNPMGTTSDYQWIETDSYVKLADINGDQLPDRIMTRRESGGVVTKWWVQINTGNGFAPVSEFACQYNQGLNTDQTIPPMAGIEYGGGISLIDINGDGLSDHVMMNKNLGASDTNFVVSLSAGPFPDLMKTVNNGTGGSVLVTYLPSTRYDNRETNSLAPPLTNMVRRLLPFPIHTVATTTVSDGIHDSITTSNFYAGGFYSSSRREFNGFARVIVRDALGGTNVNWFHQGGGWDSSIQGETTDTLGKKGMPFRVETIGTDSKTYAITQSKVHDEDLGSGRHFAFVEQTIDVDYPDTGIGNYRARATLFGYDVSNGNPTSKSDLGEVENVNLATQAFDDKLSDAVYESVTYATLANPAIIDKPDKTLVTSDALATTILRESRFDYDGQTGSLVLQRDRICLGSYSTNGFGYDAYGNVHWATNAAGVVTETTYDATYRALPTQQTIASAYTTLTSFDIRSGSLLNSTDPAGLYTEMTYDTFYRVTEEKVSSTPNGAANIWKLRHTYGVGGIVGGASLNYLRTRANDGVDATNGHEEWTYLDGLGRPIQKRIEAEASGFRVTDTRYDARGAVRFVSHPYFSGGTVAGNYAYVAPTGTKLGITTEFDPIGRAKKNSPADSGSFTAGVLTSIAAGTGDVGAPVGPSQIVYQDGNDPWIKVLTDPESKVRKYHLDAFGRTNQIVEITSAGDYTTTLSYDLLGQLKEIVDHLGNKIEYAYDDQGNVVAMADPHLGRWDYLRDFAGRVREQTDGRGFKTVYDYTDPLGRLKEVRVYNKDNEVEKRTTNFYDTGEAGYTVYAGQLFKVVDNEGWAKNSYDVRGRVLKTTRHVAINQKTYSFDQTYDDADRVKTVTYPESLLGITHTYDTGGNLTTVQTTGGGTTWFQAGDFNEFGQLSEGTFGNGVVTENEYYTASRKLKHLTAAKGANVLQELFYTYDKAANLKSVDDQVYSGAASSKVTDILYDDLHRLTSLTRPEITQTTAYSYGPTGNIAVNGEAGAGTYQYGTIRPQAVKSANGVNYAYDANGNMTVLGTKVLTYDEANNLVKVTLSPTDGVTFGYAGGTRLWKRHNDTVKQVWIGNIYEEKEGKQLCHIFAGNKRIATYEAEGSLTSDTGTTTAYYYHGDHLVSSSFLTDHAGNLVDHFDYSAFGRERYNDPLDSFAVTHRFTGQPYDPETGLYFLGFRYFSPELGRFIQPDTILADLGNPQSFNRYSYTLNNPLRYVDPSGNAGKEIADWWEARVNTAFEFYTRGSKSTALIGTLGTINTLVGGVADPLRLGADAGAVSAGGATKGEIALAALSEAGRAVSLVPVGAAIGKSTAAATQTLRGATREASVLAGGSVRSAVSNEASTLARTAKMFCFPAGTMVLLENGESKAIESIRTGDIVLADDPLDNQPPSKKVVTALHVNWTQRLYHVHIDSNSDGYGDGSFAATGEHPIWTQNRGWVPARELLPQDLLLDPKGKLSSVTSVDIEAVETLTFNLSVSDTHTFYVLAGDTPVLVHNTNPGERIYIIYQAELPNGKLYTGRASMAGVPGVTTADDVLRYRFGGGHHRGINISKTRIMEQLWGGGVGSDGYNAIRGAEQRYFERAVQKGVAAEQIAPISAKNPKLTQYLEAAKKAGVTPCQ